MKAILIKRDGFRKYMKVDRKTYEYCTIPPIEANLYPFGSKGWEDFMKREIPVIRYIFEREYDDEFDERVLIYKEE